VISYINLILCLLYVIFSSYRCWHSTLVASTCHCVSCFCLLILRKKREITAHTSIKCFCWPCWEDIAPDSIYEVLEGEGMLLVWKQLWFMSGPVNCRVCGLAWFVVSVHVSSRHCSWAWDCFRTQAIVLDLSRIQWVQMIKWYHYQKFIVVVVTCIVLPHFSVLVHSITMCLLPCLSLILLVGSFDM